MNNLLKSHLRLWFILGLAAAALLTLAFQGGETDPAHCHSCKTPTHTPTFTPTPTSTPPVVSACRISEIYFNEQLYQPGSVFTAPLESPLEITLRLVNQQGQILIGANVDATVTQTDTVQSAAISPPIDQSGTYDAVYTPESTGLHLFQFSASDMTGPRFLPCSAEALVEFEDKLPTCTLTPPTFVPYPGTVNQSITLTTKVYVNGQEQCDATADYSRTGPDPSILIQFPLRRENCAYTDTFTPTQTGNYTFTLFARDSASPARYHGCSISGYLPVIATPPPTSTPTLGFTPTHQIVDLCGRPSSDITSTLQITGVTNLARVDLGITYDRTFIIPAQITPRFGSGSVSQSGNTIRYIASSNTPVNGTADLLLITWRMQGRDGITPLALTSILTDTAGALIPHTAQNGTLEIDISPPCLRCTVNLQGRANHSGVLVTSSTGEQAQSYPNGLFAIAATGELNLTAPGYLSTQMAASAGLTAGEPKIDACQVTLLAGDANGDNTVNILDLTYLAGRYQSADPTADLNASGLVDILDLALAAGNYQRQGQ